jgi:hypothetical protein
MLVERRAYLMSESNVELRLAWMEPVSVDRTASADLTPKK